MENYNDGILTESELVMFNNVLVPLGYTSVNELVELKNWRTNPEIILYGEIFTNDLNNVQYYLHDIRNDINAYWLVNKVDSVETYTLVSEATISAFNECVKNGSLVLYKHD